MFQKGPLAVSHYDFDPRESLLWCRLHLVQQHVFAVEHVVCYGVAIKSGVPREVGSRGSAAGMRKKRNSLMAICAILPGGPLEAFG